MSNIQSVRSRFPSLRAQRDMTTEIWIGMPKGGRTGIDRNSLQTAGFAIADKESRIDDYRLVDGPDFQDVGIRIHEMKPQQALGLVGTGKLDAAIVGRDVLKEYNLGRRGKKGVAQAVEVVDLDIARCALMIAVDENDPASRASDMQGRVIATKYPRLINNWAKANRVAFSEIVSSVTDTDDIQGGIESYTQFDPRVNAIGDMVQSGESLVKYALKPLGIDDARWADIMEDVLGNIPDDRRRRFDAIPAADLPMAGLVLESTALLVRAARKMSPAKEAGFAKLAERFFSASRSLGHNPVMKDQRVAEQNAKRLRSPVSTGNAIVERYGPHGVWHEPRAAL